MSQCYAQMKISFPGLIFAQYKSINIIIIIIIIIAGEQVGETKIRMKFLPRLKAVNLLMPSSSSLT